MQIHLVRVALSHCADARNDSIGRGYRSSVNAASDRYPSNFLMILKGMPLITSLPNAAPCVNFFTSSLSKERQLLMSYLINSLFVMFADLGGSFCGGVDAVEPVGKPLGSADLCLASRSEHFFISFLISSSLSFKTFSPFSYLSSAYLRTYVRTVY